MTGKSSTAHYSKDKNIFAGVAPQVQKKMRIRRLSANRSFLYRFDNNTDYNRRPLLHRDHQFARCGGVGFAYVQLAHGELNGGGRTSQIPPRPQQNVNQLPEFRLAWIVQNVLSYENSR